MKNNYLKKYLAVAVLFLVINVSVITSSVKATENDWSIDDSIKCSYHTLNIDGSGVHVVLTGKLGNCGWYISCVSISFIYSPDVIKIWYQIDGADWIEFPVKSISICEDGEHTICWKYEDNQGNISDIECKDFKIDQTPPTMSLEWESFKENCTWFIKFTINATDETSGLDGRLWLYINEGLHDVFEYFLDWPVEFTIQWFEAFSLSSFKFACFDYAGNEASVSVNGSDIKSYSISKSITHKSNNTWFLSYLDRFNLLQRLLEWLIC